MKYLTRSYVDWLDLPEVPIDKGHDPTMRWFGDPEPQRIVRGVQRDGALYEREPDGLAFTRLG